MNVDLPRLVFASNLPLERVSEAAYNHLDDRMMVEECLDALCRAEYAEASGHLDTNTRSMQVVVVPACRGLETLQEQYRETGAVMVMMMTMTTSPLDTCILCPILSLGVDGREGPE